MSKILSTNAPITAEPGTAVPTTPSHDPSPSTAPPSTEPFTRPDPNTAPLEPPPDDGRHSTCRLPHDFEQLKLPSIK